MMPFINQVAESTANLEIRVDQSVQSAGWQQAQQLLNTAANGLTRHQVYVNYVVLHTFQNWFIHWLAEEKEEVDSLVPAVWPSEVALSEIWTLTTGSAIQLGDWKVVLVPIGDLESEQLRVPQEWVDNPDWAADYYIGCHLQIDEADDDDWLEIYGFTTHRQLKYSGVYDERSRLYKLPMAQLSEDLDALQMTLGITDRASIPALPSLSDAAAQQTIQLLSQPDVYLPRLHPDVSFEQWAGLLTCETWRHQLYQQRNDPQRMEPVSSGFVQTLSTAQEKLRSSTFNLGQWLQDQFEPVWQGVDGLLDPQQQNQVYAFMADERPVVRRARLIDLEMQLKGQAVTLLIALVPGAVADTDQKIEVRVQLFPARASEHLPEDIRLALLAQSGRVITEVVARDRDYCIQLNPFKYRIGRRFRLRLSLGERTIITDDVYVV